MAQCVSRIPYTSTTAHESPNGALLAEIWQDCSICCATAKPRLLGCLFHPVSLLLWTCLVAMALSFGHMKVLVWAPAEIVRRVLESW